MPDRELIDTGRDKRFMRRDQHESKKGQGDRGDRKR